MSTYDLKYGDTSVQIDLSKAAELTVLNGKTRPAIEDLFLSFLDAVGSKCIESKPLHQLLQFSDKVTIIISDLTRFWMRQDLILPFLVEYLHGEVGISYSNINIVIALGTHRFQTEDELKTLVTEDVFKKVNVVNHDCRADDLVMVGTTSRGNDVWVNPLVAGDNKVIVISATSHHLMSGFSGGRKSILPGVSGEQTIVRNHINSLDPILPKSNPLIGMGDISVNPVHDDMAEAAAMVAPIFGINIAVNSEGKICRLMGGDFLAAWQESCRDCQESMEADISKLADIAVVSCGGFPKDMNLYQSSKSLFNAVRSVKEDGTVVFLAQCPEGGGTPAFFDWIKPLREGRLDAALRANFTIDGYIFFAFCEAMAKRRVLLLTDIPKSELDGIPLEVYRDIHTLAKNVDFSGKSVYVLPYGGNTVPFLR